MELIYSIDHLLLFQMKTRDEMRAYWRANYHSNIEKKRKSSKRYYESHKDQKSKYGKLRAILYPGKLKAKAERYYAKNRDHILRITKEWTSRNLEKMRSYRQLWRQQNKERSKLYRQKWNAINPDRTAQQNHARKSRRLAMPFEDCSSKIKLIKSITKFCHWCCCPLNPQTVTIDHVLALSNGGHHVNDNLVGCCLKCNCSKGNRHIHEWLPTVQSV